MIKEDRINDRKSLEYFIGAGKNRNKGMEGMEIILITGEHIPISQPKRKEFMMKLTDYWGDIL